jgi:hypothetical protein
MQRCYGVRSEQLQEKMAYLHLQLLPGVHTLWTQVYQLNTLLDSKWEGHDFSGSCCSDTDMCKDRGESLSW